MRGKTARASRTATLTVPHVEGAEQPAGLEKHRLAFRKYTPVVTWDDVLFTPLPAG
jgi:hypothetical protein